MKKNYFLIILSVLILFGCKEKDRLAPYMIIPEPQEVHAGKGSLAYNYSNDQVRVQVSENYLDGGPEAYELKISRKTISVTGNSDAGVFYGLNTLQQILPPKGMLSGELLKLPCVTIRDWPVFSWRGGMLDVSRHFFPKEFILKYIDILAFHKLNHFHWHLTDGVAWRLEIKAFPELTEGVEYYSQEDVREILSYAKSKHITIIPEIEMPGHSEAALNIFPLLKCDPDQHSGVYCAGKEATFNFLELVLAEVIDLFPSEYIHIGGDEVGKSHWENCTDCQSRIKIEGLKNAEELQSYFVQRIERFLDENGRKLIGWDEILEGGLAPEATVMSWRGMKGGIEAANAGHDVVMSPGYPCYFDHYQSSNYEEPEAWGGLNGIRDVFGFNPVPQEISEGNSHHILGGQANLWTEQVATPEHAEYMMMPRYSALAEALWTGPIKKDWEWFEQKMVLQLDRYEGKDYNYAQSAFSPTYSAKYNPETRQLDIELMCELELFPLHYTLDGSKPGTASLVYKDTIALSQGQTLKAQTFRKGQTFGFPIEMHGLPNKATSRKVIYNSQWEEAYSGDKERSLTDAQLASKRGDHPNWQGFRKQDLDLILDLGKVDTVSIAWIRFFQHMQMTSVMFPRRVEFYASVDGDSYEIIGGIDLDPGEELRAQINKIELRFSARPLRYLRILAKNIGILPPGHSRAGGDAWLFTDEIGVQ